MQWLQKSNQYVPQVTKSQIDDVNIFEPVSIEVLAWGMKRIAKPFRGKSCWDRELYKWASMCTVGGMSTVEFALQTLHFS